MEQFIRRKAMPRKSRPDMLDTSFIIIRLWRASLGRLPQAFAHGRWRSLTALCMALAFALLLMTAASHHHKDSQESRACAVCGAIIDKLAGHPSTPTAVFVPVLLLYRVEIAPQYHFIVSLRRILPPSCGPPTIV